MVLLTKLSSCTHRMHQARFSAPMYNGKFIDSVDEFEKLVIVGTNFEIKLTSQNGVSEFEILFHATELKKLYKGKRTGENGQKSVDFEILNISSLFAVAQFMENWGERDGTFTAYTGYGTESYSEREVEGNGLSRETIVWPSGNTEQDRALRTWNNITYGPNGLTAYMGARYQFSTSRNDNNEDLYTIEIDTTGTGETTTYTGKIITFVFDNYSVEEFENLTGVEVLTSSDDPNFSNIKIITNARFHTGNIDPGQLYSSQVLMKRI